MPKLKPLKVEKLVSLVEKIGFCELRQKGSHKTFCHKDGRILTIPFHKGSEIPVGLLSKIIKFDLKLSREEFEGLL